MLEYFGFYDSPPAPSPEPETQPEQDVQARVAERASRLADRVRHSQPLHSAGRAWEPVGTLGGDVAPRRVEEAERRAMGSFERALERVESA